MRTLKAKEFTITASVYIDEDKNEEYKSYCSENNGEYYDCVYGPSLFDREARMKVIADLPCLRRGDIVHLDNSDYRNCGKSIYNGTDIVHLYSDLDEYGSTLPEFTTDEFPLHYWDNTIGHNSINFLPFDFDELIGNLQIERSFDEILGVTCKSKVKGVAFYICDLELLLKQCKKCKSIPIDLDDELEGWKAIYEPQY